MLCITHLPQVAVHADQHIQIQKHLTAEKQLHMQAITLNHKQREVVLTRMLGGNEADAATREHVKDLLQENRPINKIS